MKWSIKPAILFFVIINLLFAKISLCQSLEEIVRFSDQQFAKGNYELAANEYNRVLFFGYPAQDQISLKIANCYFGLNNLDQSVVFYDRAYFSTQSDSIKTEAILGKSFSLILEKDFMRALAELMNIDSTSTIDQSVRLNFLKGITYFGLKEDDEAEKAFDQCLAAIPGIKVQETFEKEFAAIRKSEKRFNPKTAWTLSMFLPGAGQLYAGNIKESTNSAALLGGLIYLTVAFAKKFSFIEAIVVVIPWFQRYYIGGANKAERLALEKQLGKRNEMYQKVIHRLESESAKNPVN